MTADTPDLTPLQAAAKPIAEAAKKSHSLKDRLAGVKPGVKKVLVFDDEEPVTAFAAIERELAIVETMLGDQDTSAEDRRLLRGRLEPLEERKEVARVEMLAHALSVHLQAVPDVVMDAGRRKARKAYAIDGVFPDDVIEDANALQQRYILGRVIQRVVDHDGDALEFDRDEVANLLRETLPFAQWQRVVSAYNEIVFTDQIGTQATLDPGF